MLSGMCNVRAMEGAASPMASLGFRLFSHGHSPAILGESPCVDAQNNALWWVDVEGKRLFESQLDSGETREWELPEHPGFVVLTENGEPVVGLQTGIFAFSPLVQSFEKLVDFAVPGCRFNDATVDHTGRLWVSTMALDAKPGRAAIHLVSDTFHLRTLVDGLAIPNGIAVDPVRRRFFFSDSHPKVQTIWLMQMDDIPGVLGEPERFASTVHLRGRPDGAAIDAEGNYWIAGVDGGEIYMFGPQGNLKQSFKFPCVAPTKISFAGPDLRSLLVTSKHANCETGGYLMRAYLPPEATGGIPQYRWRAPGYCDPKNSAKSANSFHQPEVRRASAQS